MIPNPLPTLESLAIAGIQPALNRVDDAADPTIRHLLGKAKEQLTTGSTEDGLKTMADVYAIRATAARAKAAIIPMDIEYVREGYLHEAKDWTERTYPGRFTMAELLDMAWKQIRDMKPTSRLVFTYCDEPVNDCIWNRRSVDILRYHFVGIDHGTTKRKENS
jgi:hypothetical protein